jgi:hypothetical protein
MSMPPQSSGTKNKPNKKPILSMQQAELVDPEDGGEMLL